MVKMASLIHHNHDFTYHLRCAWVGIKNGTPKSNMLDQVPPDAKSHARGPLYELEIHQSIPFLDDYDDDLKSVW